MLSHFVVQSSIWHLNTQAVDFESTNRALQAKLCRIWALSERALDPCSMVHPAILLECCNAGHRP